MIWIALALTAVIGRALVPACPSFLVAFPVGAAAVSLQLLLFDDRCCRKLLWMQ